MDDKVLMAFDRDDVSCIYYLYFDFIHVYAYLCPYMIVDRNDI